MNRVTNGQAAIQLEEIAGGVDELAGDRQRDRNDAPDGLIDAPPIRPPPHRPVAMQDLLQRLGVDCRVDLALRDAVSVS